MKETVKPGNLHIFGRILVLAAGLFILASWSAAIPEAEAAEITIPRLELGSRGWFNDDGEFAVSSRISLDIALAGGYKYSFLLGLSLEAPDIAKAIAHRNYSFTPYPDSQPMLGEDVNAVIEHQKNQAYIGFRVAKATIKNMFNLPLSMSYFVGSGDDFCTGDDISSMFGVYPFGTDYKGFFYFPTGIGGNMMRQYNGIHGAKGTGLSLAITKWDNIVIPMFYIYQDFALFPNFSSLGASGINQYSGDIRVLFHWNWLSFEALGGVTWNSDMDVKIRMGLMLYLAGKGVEFFAQAGITSWKTGEKINVDNMFFLIEPRLRFRIFAIHVTFFYHPVEYLHIEEQKEQGMADFNVKFMFGKENAGFTAGLETTVELKTDNMDDFLFRLSPFGSFTSGGLLWETKLRLMPQKFKSPKEMMEIFIGVRTAF